MGLIVLTRLKREFGFTRVTQSGFITFNDFQFERPTRTWKYTQYFFIRNMTLKN